MDAHILYYVIFTIGAGTSTQSVTKESLKSCYFQNKCNNWSGWKCNTSSCTAELQCQHATTSEISAWKNHGDSKCDISTGGACCKGELSEQVYRTWNSGGLCHYALYIGDQNVTYNCQAPFVSTFFPNTQSTTPTIFKNTTTTSTTTAITVQTTFETSNTTIETSEITNVVPKPTIRTHMQTTKTPKTISKTTTPTSTTTAIKVQTTFETTNTTIELSEITSVLPKPIYGTHIQTTKAPKKIFETTQPTIGKSRPTIEKTKPILGGQNTRSKQPTYTSEATPNQLLSKINEFKDSETSYSEKFSVTYIAIIVTGCISVVFIVISIVLCVVWRRSMNQSRPIHTEP